MLDRVEHLRETGLSLEEALVQSGRRRLRPVLMTSLAAALGMVPLVLGHGTGNQMLRPLAIAVMGALAISVLLSLIATPATYFLLMQQFGKNANLSFSRSESADRLVEFRSAVAVAGPTG